MTSEFVGLQFGGQKELDGKVFHSVFCISFSALAPERGGTPYNGLQYTGRLRPKGIPFFSLQVYKRVGISQVEEK